MNEKEDSKLSRDGQLRAYLGTNNCDHRIILVNSKQVIFLKHSNFDEVFILMGMGRISDAEYERMSELCLDIEDQVNEDSSDKDCNDTIMGDR